MFSFDLVDCEKLKGDLIILLISEKVDLDI